MGFLDGLLGGQQQQQEDGTRLEGQNVGATLYDPQTLELAQAYGMHPALVQQAQAERQQAVLGNLGATLLAAGQAGPVGQRGQLLSKMDLSGGQPMTTSLLNSAQMQLYAEQVKDKQQARKDQEAFNAQLKAAAGGGAGVAGGGASGGKASPVLTPQQAAALSALPAAQRVAAYQKFIEDNLKTPEWSDPYKEGNRLYKKNLKTNEVKEVGSGNNISIDLGAKGANKLDVDEVEADQKRAASGADIRGALDILHTQLMNGADTSAVQAASLPLRKMLVGAGLMSDEKAKEVNNQELFQAASQYIVPRMRPQGSGSTSNMEEGMYAQAAPNLSKLPEGNLFNVAYLRQQHDYAERYARTKKEYFREHDGLKGWDDSKVDGPIRTAAAPEDFAKIKVGEMYYSPDLAKFGAKYNYGFKIKRAGD